MNRDSCINMAAVLQEYASEKNDKRNFVMISASRSIPFIPAYLATKEEAEKFLIEECSNLRVTIIKPGVITSWSERKWSVPVGWMCNYYYNINERFYKKIPGMGNKMDSILPDRPTRLEDIGNIAVKGVLGLNQKMIYSTQEFIEAEEESKAGKK